jgi:AraC family transcriptional regulator, transcriptional activator of pobA
MTKPLIQKLHPIESLGNIPAKQGEIRIEQLESRLKPRVPFPHRHDFYHFVYIIRGTGWHEIDFQRHPVKPRQCFYVRPGQVHAWDLGKSTKGYIIEFTKESLSKEGSEILKKAESLPELLLPKDSGTIESLLVLMHREFRGAKVSLSLEHYLCLFLLEALRANSSSLPIKISQKPSDLISRFRALVDANFHKEHTVEFYATSLGISSKSLTTKVTKALGKPAGTVIQERCLTEAKRLLSYSDMSVAEIGYNLGFDDPNYFARFFRQKIGMAPGKFRKLATHSVH